MTMNLYILFFILLLSYPNFCMSQFGILKNNKDSDKNDNAVPPRNDDLDAVSQEQMRGYMMVATKLQAAAPTLPSQDAVDLAALLDGVGRDPETQKMILNLRNADGRKANLEAFSDSVTQREVVEGLKQTLDELKALEYLFQDDPARAVLEMNKDGMVPQDRLDFYTRNPEQLAEDTRKGLYFSFVSLAVAGGFL
jgi:hypothetical protein